MTVLQETYDHIAATAPRPRGPATALARAQAVQEGAWMLRAMRDRLLHLEESLEGRRLQAHAGWLDAAERLIDARRALLDAEFALLDLRGALMREE